MSHGRIDKKERRSFNGSYTFYSEKFTEIYKDINIIYTIVFTHRCLWTLF